MKDAEVMEAWERLRMAEPMWKSLPFWNLWFKVA